MSRNFLSKWILLLAILGFYITYGLACGGSSEPSEMAPKDASATKEAKPEPPPVREAAPDGHQQPEGVGDKCRKSGLSAQGSCKSKALLCGTVDSSSNICFENCITTKKCALATEKCSIVKEISSIPICVTIAKKGEACGLNKRIICPGEISEPPLFCVQGKCQEKPKDGWSIGQVCSPPRGNQQSDCKAGLICVKHARDLFKCIKPCTADKDCPTGEICWEKPLKIKVCLIPAKTGEKCNGLERRFCKTSNPLNPLQCKSGVCKGEKELKQLGEKCTKSVTPGQERGNCDQGMVCLGVSRLKSICHKACSGTSNCPSGELCVMHPNVGPGDPIQACIIPIAPGKNCDLTERKMCKQEKTKFFQCKKPDEKATKGVCTEVKVGDGCVNDGDCGRMLCIAIDPNTPAKKYCLMPCDPKAPQCPDKGACRPWAKDGPTACVPTGPKQQDEACNSPQAVGDKLNTTKFCTGGLGCVSFKKGSPSGICMKPVAQCTAGACSAGHICLAQKSSGLCARDCSKGPTACKPGTKCVAIKTGKICGPTL